MAGEVGVASPPPVIEPGSSSTLAVDSLPTDLVNFTVSNAAAILSKRSTSAAASETIKNIAVPANAVAPESPTFDRPFSSNLEISSLQRRELDDQGEVIDTPEDNSPPSITSTQELKEHN
mmetsp:Transcript_19185/g.28357  ORF Transcript_19185/g.28357 Transcript_19185/m.28357 type:complete len:120 (+) Transcript_19185:1-360(+)